MTATALIDATAAGALPLRNEPVQARSTARLAALLDAAAAVVAEIGYERLTTAMVAERAGASIGTVYRYFPDRIAVLQALGARNLERALTRVNDVIADEKHTNWAEALGAAYGSLVELFHSEPGFRSLRSGDVIDLHPASNDRTYNSILAEAMYNGLVARFDIVDSPEARFAFETSLEISDALAARAFARNPEGDESFMVVGRDVTFSMLAPFFGNPE